MDGNSDVCPSDRTISQLTKDHTFVQSLIDEGRITEEEARTHPHRNLILKALDAVHDTEPDQFHVDLAEGDRVFLCSEDRKSVVYGKSVSGGVDQRGSRIIKKKDKVQKETT